MGTPAPACKKVLAQMTELFPARNKSSDGIMGDAAHALRKSDHNDGHAVDVTRDDRFFDSWKLATGLAGDPRSDYVIHKRRIYSKARPYWRVYLGTNPHTGHVHMSILDAHLKNTLRWPAIDLLKPAPAKPPTAPPTSPVGTPRPYVRVDHTGSVNVRSGPSIFSRVVHIVTYGERLYYLGNDGKSGGKWFLVQDGSFKGWVHSDFVSKVMT